MPLVRIEVRKSYSLQQGRNMIEAVHKAQCEVLRIPEHDRQIRLIEHRPEHFEVPPGKSQNYTLVEITLFSGRSLEVKRALYKAIVDNLGRCGIAPDDIFIVLNEQPRENWGIRGGQAACDVELGFKIE